MDDLLLKNVSITKNADKSKNKYLKLDDLINTPIKDNGNIDCLKNPVIGEYQKITDKHGLILLIAIFLIWTASCGYVISNGLYPTPQHINNIQTNVTSEFKQYFTTKKWLFDILTYEYPPPPSRYERRYYKLADTYFQIGYESSFYFFDSVINFIYVFMTPKFIKRTHDMTYFAGLIVIGMGYIGMSIVYRTVFYFISDFIPEREYHKLYLFWMVPEFILFLLVLLVAFCMWRSYPAYARHKLKRSLRWLNKLYCAIIFAFFLLLAIISIKILTDGLIANLSWTNPLLHVIVVGSCYLAFFIYNFGNAVTTVVIWNMIDGNKGPFKTLIRAIISVSKYHLGSIALRATIILPLIVINQERSNIRKILEGNVDKTFGVRIKSELERSREHPDLEIVYNKTWPPGWRGTDGLHFRYWKNHYIVQVFKSSLMLIVIRGVSFRESTKAILTRHSLDQQLPSSTVFLIGFPCIFFLQVVIYETCRVCFQPFDTEDCSIPCVHPVYLIGFVAQCKIFIGIFLLGMMLMNNFELTIEFCNIQYNERSHINEESAKKKVLLKDTDVKKYSMKVTAV